jgi:hypothetical protein
VNRVAGQTVFGCERSDATILNAAQATVLGGGPHRSILVDLKAGDVAFTKPISGGVRRPDLTILEIQNAAILPE